VGNLWLTLVSDIPCEAIGDLVLGAIVGKGTMLFDFLKGNHFGKATTTMPWLWGVKGPAYLGCVTFGVRHDLTRCGSVIYGT
jgi:hypothetical protein